MAGQFFHRFGKQVAILHSGIRRSERADQWRRIRTGRARVVVGTRSGVFAPVQDLGLLIVDEEHDGSYKQQECRVTTAATWQLYAPRNWEQWPCLAQRRPASRPVITPTQSKYTLLRLPERIAQRPMPQVEIVDMRVEFLETKRQATFSRRLLEEIEEAARGRRADHAAASIGAASRVSWFAARAEKRMHCANCSLVLTHHRRDRRMLCHDCGYAEKIPTECPNCGSEYIQFLGIGSERVEDELHQRFPTARIARLDRDMVDAERGIRTMSCSSSAKG